jgi:hypothetical protein
MQVNGSATTTAFTPASLNISVDPSSAQSGVQVVTLNPTTSGVQPQTILILVNKICSVACPQGQGTDQPPPVATPPILNFPASNGALSQTLTLGLPSNYVFNGIGQAQAFVDGISQGQSSSGSISPNFVASPAVTSTATIGIGAVPGDFTVTVDPAQLQAGSRTVPQLRLGSVELVLKMFSLASNTSCLLW